MLEQLAVLHSQFIRKDELRVAFHSRNCLIIIRYSPYTFELVHAEPFFEPVVEEEEFLIPRKVKELHLIVLAECRLMSSKVYVIYIPIEVKNWLLVGIRILCSRGLVGRLSPVLQCYLLYRICLAFIIETNFIQELPGAAEGHEPSS